MKLGEPRQLLTRPRCLSCGELLDGATAVEADHEVDRLPEPGDVCVCTYCGHVMVFADDLTMRELTGEEIREIAGDARILALQQARKRMADDDGSPK